MTSSYGLIISIIICSVLSYCLYGAFYRRSGEKVYNIGKRYFPFSVFVQGFKKEESFARFYKVVIVISIIGMLIAIWAILCKLR